MSTRSKILTLFGFAILLGFFYAFGNISPVNAQGVCSAPPDYCIGTKVLDVGTGCSRSGNTCRTDYDRRTISCNGSCQYSHYGYACQSSTPNSNGQCPSQAQQYTGTCCVNSGGNNQCNNNGNCEDGEDENNCPNDCPPTGGDPTRCNDLCAEGVYSGSGISVTWEDTSICDAAGLTCAGWQAATGACDTNGESCFRVCTGNVCSTSNNGPADIAGSVKNSLGAPLSGVPIAVTNMETGLVTTAITNQIGAWSVDTIGYNTNYSVTPLWTKRWQDGITPTPYVPDGLKGIGKTTRSSNGSLVPCTSSGSPKYTCIDHSTQNNVPVESASFSNQESGYFNAGVGLAVSDGCGSRYNLDNDLVGSRCNFVYNVVANYPPTATISAPDGTSFPYTQNVRFTLNAADRDNNLSYGQVFIRKGTATEWQSPTWVKVPGPTTPDIQCSGGTCTGTVTLNMQQLFPPTSPPPGGYTGSWWVMVQAVDTFGWRLNDPESGICTGRPGTSTPNNNQLPNGYANCNRVSGVDALMLTVTPPPPVTVSGNIHRVPNNNTCTNQGALTLGPPNPISNPSLTVTYRDTGGTFTGTGSWNSSSGNYSIPNVPQGSGTIGVDQEIQPAGLPTFKYRLQCINGSTAGVVGNTASLTVDSNPETANLGYKLVSKGWFTTRDGDVYAGYKDNSSTNPSVTVGIPLDADVTPSGFWAYLVNTGTVFGGEELSVKDPSSASKYATPINRSAKYLRPTSTWPASYDFTPPSNSSVVNISNCSGLLSSTSLNPNNVYVGTGACINTALSNASPTGYTVASDGIVVIYATTTDELVFTRNVRVAGNNANRRILIVTPGSVRVSRNVGQALVLTTTQPHIQASIIANGGIKFEGTTDSTASPDTTVFIDGPLITGGFSASRNSGLINMDRDRGTGNNIPSEVIIYNKNLIHQLTYSERNNPILNRTGLFVVDVTIDSED